MIRKLLSASILTVCCIINSMAQQPNDTLYSGSTSILAAYYGSSDSTGGPVAACGLDGRQEVITYSTIYTNNKYYGGGGIWQINGYPYWAAGPKTIRD